MPAKPRTRNRRPQPAVAAAEIASMVKGLTDSERKRLAQWLSRLLASESDTIPPAADGGRDATR